MTQKSAPRALSIEPLAGPAADSLSLAYDARWRRRGLLVTDAGEEVLLDLPEATELAEGLALVLGDGRRVALRAAPEPLAEARAGDAAGLARLAWHVGNRHTPCAVEADRLLIRRDHVLENMLEHLGAAVTHVLEPFRPEGGAYGHGRTHGHAHGHDPHQDPDAHLREPG
ncbi:urease accessory protein UreE [Albimonas sp. CAU 1670]|uniref:urease accessory protein UreE n=1 Tax=Albimonas sp. CAU 1670 TaxID=3032599 RepID=UPI0023DB3C78|nr:urease accessory protein UreE [Albimonas sp. CAU 1670]MDF2232738.1 urease accessory protein UreE [Albimonas sp. CAU 1670]